MAQSEPLQHSSNLVVDKPVETWNGKKVLGTTSQPSRAELQTSLICIINIWHFCMTESRQVCDRNKSGVVIIPMVTRWPFQQARPPAVLLDPAPAISTCACNTMLPHSWRISLLPSRKPSPDTRPHS